MNKLIDTHAHIYLDHFQDNLEQYIKDIREAGVERIYMPDIDQSSTSKMLSMAENYPDLCIPMIGLHPCSVNEQYSKELKRIEQELAKRPYAGIGETGIDLYWDKSTFRLQQKALEVQLTWAGETGLPIILHTREATDETIEMVQRYQNGNLKGVFHCFSGTHEQAQKIVDLDFFIGIGGVVTFKNSDLKNVLVNVPLEQIVLETDAPYLAPVPYRGKQNTPAYLPYIAKKVAEIYGKDMTEIAGITNDNARRLFVNS